MFAVDMTAGHLAKSQALQADALDFAGDVMTYGISLAVIGASLRARTSAALFKGFSLLLMGLWVFDRPSTASSMSELPQPRLWALLACWLC